MGFGRRGTEGKIAAIRYARENNIPFLGICFGMQMAVVEFARHVCGLEEAHSTEVNEKTSDPVIALMDEQREVVDKGGTMRLGAYPCVLADRSLALSLYTKKGIAERHRHRYEFNNAYRELFSSKGMIFSGLSPDGTLVEAVELRDHPWFIGVQFHPEFTSRPFECHPLFSGFIQAGIQRRVASRRSSRLRGQALTRREHSPPGVSVGSLTFGGGTPFVLIAGPCVIEDRDSALRHAEALLSLTARLHVPFIYKSSYDKANRSSHSSFRGLGMEEGLSILAEVKREVGVRSLQMCIRPRRYQLLHKSLIFFRFPPFYAARPICFLPRDTASSP